MKILRGLIFFGVLTYGFAAAAAYFGQNKILYYPDVRPLASCSLPDGVKLWNEGPEQGLLTSKSRNNLLVFYHGNAGSACEWRFLGVNHLARLGYDVLVVEYPGYGGDIRKTSKREIEAGVGRVSGWVARQNYDNVVVMGHSLGAAVAALFAREHATSKVILFAPFDSVYNMAVAQGLAFPRVLLHEDFDNIDALEEVNAAITIVHGEEDTVIAPVHSENLVKELLTLNRNVTREVRAGVGHNNLFQNPAFDAFLQHTLLP